MSDQRFSFSGLKEILHLQLPEFLKFGPFGEIRRGVLDRPKLTIANRKHGIGKYAFVCTTAPYLFALSISWLINTTNLLPPDPVQRSLADIRGWESDIAEKAGADRVTCERLRVLDAESGRQCTEMSAEVISGYREDLETLRQETLAFEVARSSTVLGIFSVVALVLSGFFFTRIWLRFNPIHLKRTSADVDKVWRAYVLVISTSVFIPNCIGAVIFVAINIATRFETAAMGTLSGWLVVAGFLPFAVSGVLGSYRLNQILLDSSDWRMRKTWWIIFLSNVATSVCLFTMIALGLLIYLTHAMS